MSPATLKKKRNHRWMNPGTLWLYIWAFTIFLFLLDLSEETIPASAFAVGYVCLCVLIVFLTGQSRKVIPLNTENNPYQENYGNIALVSLALLALLVFEVASEIAYFKTLPFLASFSFDQVNYNDPTTIFKFRHNVFVKSNSIFLSGFFYFLYQFYNRKRIYLAGYLFILFIALLYLSRSTMISIGVITLLIYLYNNKIRFKQFLIIAVVMVLIFFVFDKIYFLRNKTNEAFYQTQYQDYGFLTSVNRGMESIYAYVASPLSNFLFNIDYESFTEFGASHSLFIRGFLPTEMGNAFFGDPNMALITFHWPGTSNTFTAFPPVLYSYGIVGSVVFFAIFGFLTKLLYLKSVSNPQRWLLPLMFFNHIIILSVFSTSLNNLVFYFPILVAYFFPPMKKRPAPLYPYNSDRTLT